MEKYPVRSVSTSVREQLILLDCTEFSQQKKKLTIQEAGDWTIPINGARSRSTLVLKSPKIWFESVEVKFYVNGEDREQMVELSVEGKEASCRYWRPVKSACSMVGKVARNKANRCYC